LEAAVVLDITKVEQLHGRELRLLELLTVVVVALLQQGAHMVAAVTQRHLVWARQVVNFKADTETTTEEAAVADGMEAAVAQRRVVWEVTVAAVHPIRLDLHPQAAQTDPVEPRVERHCRIM
jgi:hypothetical protein